MERINIGAWSKASVSVHLSHKRREKLRAYVNEGEQSPTEAIYALIDSAPLRAKPVLDPNQSVLDAIEKLNRQAEDQAEMTRQHAAAITAVSSALGPIHQLLKSMHHAEQQEETSSPVSGLLSSQWIQHLIATTQSQGHQIITACRWHRTEMMASHMSIQFLTARIIQGPSGRTTTPLPNLQIENLPIDWRIAQKLNQYLASDLFLLCSRTSEGKWQGMIINAQKEQLLTFLF